MNAEVRLADKILMLGSPKYVEKVHAMEEGKKVTGGGWEAMLVTSAIWTGIKSRADLVVAIFRGSWRDATPNFASALPPWTSPTTPPSRNNTANCYNAFTSEPSSHRR